MAVTQYIGARYVPIFDGEWDNTKTYEPLTVVQYQGNSFTSKQAVPVGIEITNTQFWAETGNYNAQVEAYRQEVFSFDNRITSNTNAISDEVTNRQNADTALSNDISAEALARSNADTALGNDISAEALARQNADSAIGNELNSEALARQNADNAIINNMNLKGQYIGVIGDSFSTHNTYDYWPQIMARKTGCTMLNYAVNATGFTMGTASTKFEGQLEALADDPNFDKLKCIIVYGGINDYNFGASASITTNAINSFLSAYEAIENRPPLILAFGNIGLASLAQYNSFTNWYQEVVHNLENSDAVIVDNVPYWLMPYTTFNSDHVHPDSWGQHVIYNYMYRLVTGTYSGQTLSWQGYAINNKVRYQVNVNNGVINLHLRFVDQVHLSNLESNSWYDLGELFTAPMMIGEGNTTTMGAWCYSWPIVESVSGSSICILRPLFNAGNRHLYIQVFGDATLFPDGYSIGGDQECQFTIFPSVGL